MEVVRLNNTIQKTSSLYKMPTHTSIRMDLKLPPFTVVKL